ncbi:diguanylate cyclase [Erwinia sp. MMLR14_017]|uniref:diguanylate cyclase n=1 Tax=Erwinia sp. MMLR14_017 TaxID=3093842 RepID=UPI0029904516|nr:diguanylate cyclase [Erwinia sp. MMLR14_017]MDW8847189.1 diguanylate cyclase [Erwinia sp. MMLR14_017]
MTTDTLFSVDRSWRTWLLALLPGVLSFALTLFCLEMIKVSGQISPLWFSTTLMTILIFRLPVASLPRVLFSCFVGIVAANALVIGPAISNILFPVVNLLQALLGGALLRILLDRKSPLDSLLSWSKMMVTVGLFTPLIGGLLATWLLTLTGHASFRFFSAWVISETIGMLALGPVCLLWKNDYFQRAGHALFETLLTLIITLILSYFSLRYVPWPFTFVVVVLFYSAVRLPRFEAFCIFLATLSLMTLMLALGLLEVQTSKLLPLASATWLPFLMALIPSHMMALVLHSFREEKKHITESETRFRHAMEYSAIGMALVSPEGKWLQVNKSLCKLLGYQDEELKKTDFQHLTHPVDLHADLEKVNALLLGDIETYSIEKRYFRKDSQIVWARLTVSLVRDSEQLPLYFISQIEDITDLKKTEEVNRRLMQRITLANEAGGIGVWEWSLTSGKMSWDKRMFQIYGLSANGQASYLTWVNSLLAADRQRAIDAFDNAIKTSTPLDLEFRIETEQGIRYIRSQANMVLNEKGAVERMLGINQDVTPMRQLTEALYQEKERMHITLDAIGEAVISTDEEMRVIFMNPVAESMTGWTQEKAAGQPISDILQITHGRKGPPLQSPLLCELPQAKSTPALEHELVLHNSAGLLYDIHYSITPLKTLEGSNIGSVMVIQDVSESRELVRRLSYSASHDMLTSLPNRVSFEQRLKTLLVSAAEHHHHALVFIDLDRFKAVNDSAGHAAGDALLREISGVMQRHLRRSDFLARLGGDEFGVLLRDCPLDKAREVTDRIVDAVNDYRFLWEGRLHRVGASAGITLINSDNHAASEVMAQADLACYNAKHNGRGQLSVYDPQLLKTLKPLLTRRENEQIITGQPMRLMVSAVVPPRKPHSATFYLAEMQLFTQQGVEIDETSFRAGLTDEDLIIALDRKLIAEFFQHYAQGVLNKALTIVLPLSEQGVRDDAFITETLAYITRFGLPGDLLHFSLHARALIGADKQICHNLARLRKQGCKIVLSEFGHNLDAFSRLPGELIDYLSLSPQLTANVHCNLMDEMMVAILQGHAQRMNIATFTGPVEQQAALNTLATIGVDAVWGGVVSPREPLSTLLMNSYFAIK